MKKSSKAEIVLKGLGAAPGICIGKAYVVDRNGVEIISRYAIPEKALKTEVKRFKSAVQHAKTALRSVIDNSPPELYKATILETHIALLNDKLLYNRTIECIEKERVNAEWALKSVVAQIRAAFMEMPDTYLRERASDIVHVSDLVMRNLLGAQVQSIGTIDRRVILVARDLSAADTSRSTWSGSRASSPTWAARPRTRASSPRRWKSRPWWASRWPPGRSRTKTC